MIFYRKQRKEELKEILFYLLRRNWELLQKKSKLDDGTSFWTWIMPDERV